MTTRPRDPAGRPHAAPHPSAAALRQRRRRAGGRLQTLPTSALSICPLASNNQPHLGDAWHAACSPTRETHEGLPMDTLQLTHAPTMKTGMLIRRPAAEVFEAFVNPVITAKFWFSRSSGRLEVGRRVQWDWEMYDISIPVTATVVEPGRRLVVEWPGYGHPTTVEWTFAPQAGDSTFV